MKTFTLFLLLFPLLVLAQPQSYNWYFGNQYGLNFSTGTPVLLTDGSMVAFEGCATISDAEGNLLFYSNGGGQPLASGTEVTGAIWNKNHELMYDMGDNEGGGVSAVQSSLIIPRPGTLNHYYLFTMEETEFMGGGTPPDQPLGRGLSFFEIDMDLNGGLGGVINADQRLFTPAYEILSGTIHGNGQDYWIFTVQNTNDENRFVRLRVGSEELTPADIEFIPVDAGVLLAGSIKFSPDNRWISCGGNIFPFDDQTGNIDVAGAINLSSLSFNSFSPSSRYCYMWLSLTQLARFDLMASDIVASQQVVYTRSMDVIPAPLQLASNGNIYLNYFDFPNQQVLIGEIKCPDSENPIIVPELFNFPITEPNDLFIGLPNFTDYIFRKENDTTPETLTPITRAFCEEEELVLVARIEGESYLWNDGSSTPTLAIDTPGDYTVTITDACGKVYIDEQIVTQEDTPAYSISPLPSPLCYDQLYNVEVQTASDNDVAWSTGANTPSIEVAEAGIYSVTVSNSCGSITEDISLTFDFCNGEDECDLYFPNAFSPNNDGVNDTFRGFGDCQPIAFELSIYSRWGQQVFTTDNFNQGWPGAFRGQKSPAEVYVYVARYRFSERLDFIERSGDLLLIR